MVLPPGPRRYPLRNERDAPQFDGTGRSDREIERYMEDVETLVGQCEATVTDTMLIQKAKYYCSADIEGVSGSLPKVKIIHDLRTQGFLAFGNQGDKV